MRRKVYPIIMELVPEGDAPIIMAGAGFVQITCRISSCRSTGSTQFAGSLLPSPMRYRNQGLSMSAGNIQADGILAYRVEGAAVAEMKGIIVRHQANDFTTVASCRLI